VKLKLQAVWLRGEAHSVSRVGVLGAHASH